MGGLPEEKASHASLKAIFHIGERSFHIFFILRESELQYSALNGSAEEVPLAEAVGHIVVIVLVVDKLGEAG